MKLIKADATASSALSNTVTETVLKSHLFPAGFWQVGKVVRARIGVRATATNSTDTLAVLARLGAAALTGTSLGGQAALDVANDDVCVLDVELICRTAGSSGVIVATMLTAKDAAGTVAGGQVVVVSSLDLTADTYLGFTGQWSVANAGNSCLADCLTVYEAV